MTEVDRRNLIGLAGASLLLAGCNSRDVDNRSETLDAAAMTGPCPAHGDLTTDAVTASFVPAYVRVVYLRFQGMKLVARQGHVALQGRDLADEDMKTAVTALLVDLRAGRGYDIDNIDIISCGGPLVLLVFLDNDAGDVTFVEDGRYVFRFSPFRGAPPFELAAREENYAFYDPRRLQFTSGALAGRTAYRLKFFSRRKDSNDASGYSPIPMATPGQAATYFLYSMNIHLRMATQRASSWIPLVIDPDTGNMGTNP